MLTGYGRDALGEASLLGFSYNDGEGVAKNGVTAQMWHVLAALREQRHAVEARELTEGSADPKVVSESFVRAVACLKSLYKNCD